MNKKYKGNEFTKGELALLEGKYLVTIIEWTKEYGGWWYVQLQNGGLHYSQLISKKQQP